jgi:hypothetical protein
MHACMLALLHLCMYGVYMYVSLGLNYGCTPAVSTRSVLNLSSLLFCLQSYTQVLSQEHSWSGYWPHTAARRKENLVHCKARFEGERRGLDTCDTGIKRRRKEKREMVAHFEGRGRPAALVANFHLESLRGEECLLCSTSVHVCMYVCVHA